MTSELQVVPIEELGPAIPAEEIFDEVPETPSVNALLHPVSSFRALVTALGPVGLFPLGVLFGLTLVERFVAVAFGVLSPEIRRYFGLSHAGIDLNASLTGAVPILLSVP